MCARMRLACHAEIVCGARATPAAGCAAMRRWRWLGCGMTRARRQARPGLLSPCTWATVPSYCGSLSCQQQTERWRQLLCPAVPSPPPALVAHACWCAVSARGTLLPCPFLPSAGLPVLLDFYRGAYFHPGTDAPRTVAIADPSEYFVAQAVVTAGARLRDTICQGQPWSHSLRSAIFNWLADSAGAYCRAAGSDHAL